MEPVSVPTQFHPAEKSKERYLSFLLGGEEFAVSIIQVREIVGIMKIVELPQAPPWMKGVINLRAHIIPVICLRTKLGMEEKEHTEKSCIIIAELAAHALSHAAGPEGESAVAAAVRPAGIIVDSVSEVLAIPAGSIEHPPELPADTGPRVITGLATTSRGVRILLDFDQLLAAEGIVRLPSTTP